MRPGGQCRVRTLGSGQTTAPGRTMMRLVPFVWRSDVYAGLLHSAAALALSTATVAAQMQKVGDPPEASNMRLVGHSDLQARSAYQPTIHHQGDRWIAYVGHHGGTDTVPKPVNPLTGQPEFSGTSIIDVT